MSKMKWDQVGEKLYETGVEQCALFRQTSSGAYGTGVAWSGITGISDSPSGAEPSPIYADNRKYLELMSAEEYGATITAYMSPEEFDECDGTKEIADGVMIAQQDRIPFGLVYKTIIGNDTKKNKYGYKLHIIYGALAKTSSKDYKTVNNDPDVMELSWEVSTTPVDVEGMNPTSKLVIDSTKADPVKLAELEKIIYGSADSEPRLPLPDEIAVLMKKDPVEPSGPSGPSGE